MPKRPQGYCRICGQFGPLSQEHVIPEAAGNDQPVWVRNFRSVVKGWVRGEYLQAGLVRSSLCPRCNSQTGSKYVPAFARWTIQAAEYHGRVRAGNHVLLPFTVDSLAVSKQIAVMTLAMSGAESIRLPHFMALRRFVMSRWWHEPMRDFRFFAYLHFGPATFEGVFMAMKTTGGPCPVVYSHVGMEPLGYVVTASDGASRDWAR
jgi:hypothetical protein